MEMENDQAGLFDILVLNGTAESKNLANPPREHSTTRATTGGVEWYLMQMHVLEDVPPSTHHQNKCRREKKATTRLGEVKKWRRQNQKSN